MHEQNEYIDKTLNLISLAMCRASLSLACSLFALPFSLLHTDRFCINLCNVYEVRLRLRLLFFNLGRQKSRSADFRSCLNFDN